MLNLEHDGSEALLDPGDQFFLARLRIDQFGHHRLLAKEVLGDLICIVGPGRNGSLVIDDFGVDAV